MTNLTLTLNDATVEKARKLAVASGTSVDELIAELVEAGSAIELWKSQLPAITRSLLGIAPAMTDEEADAALEDGLQERFDRK